MSRDYHRLPLVISQTSGEDAGGFGVFGPISHAFGVAEGGDPFEKSDEVLAALPVALAEGVAEILTPGFGILISGGGFAESEKEMPQGRGGEGMGGAARGATGAERGDGIFHIADRGEVGSGEAARGVHTGAVGLVALEERADVVDAEASGEFFIHTFASLAPALDIEGAEVVALDEGEIAPARFEASGDEGVAGDLDGALDHDLEVALGLAVADREDLVLDIAPVEGGVLGEDLERGGVGPELVVGVVEIRFPVFIEGLHRGDLAADFIFDEGIDFVEKAGFGRSALAEDETDGAGDVVAFFDADRFGLGADRPGGGRFETGGPEDHPEVSPDGRVLMGELHHLETVVRHVASEIAIDLDHGMAEVVAVTPHREFGAGVWRPLRKGLREGFIIPGEKEITQFVVVHGIGIRWIGDPEIAGFAEVARVDCRNILNTC